MHLARDPGASRSGFGQGNVVEKNVETAPGVAFSVTARGGRGRACEAGAGQLVGRVHLATTLTTH
eukprot:3802291-Prymnesium_polylepis.1